MRLSPWILAPLLLLAACAHEQFPATGPRRGDIQDLAAQEAVTAIQVVDVDADVARRLLATRSTRMFSEALGSAHPPETLIGAGDAVEITIWEAPPATLFGTTSIDPRTGTSTPVAVTLPEQIVNRDGYITVPFAGQIAANGRTPQAVQTAITSRLKGKANQPEVLVRVTKNTSSNVTVVGEVTNSVRMPLTASGERLLDALAAAGGVRHPVHKMALQVTRDKSFYSLPLDTVIRDPKQNIPLHAGDVVTALFQPNSFSALGATGTNTEVDFETQGITLAQALARAGGLVDNRASPEGVFIFRFEPQGTLDWPRKPVMATPEGMVPVVYHINLRNPNSFFVMQSFDMRNKDVLYVANAPTAELQKFLNLIFSVTYPVLGVINAIER